MEINEIARWSAPREVQTKNGPRILRTAPADDKFWSAWRAAKDALKAAGISCGQKDGRWEATWWQQLDADTVATRNEAIAASQRASSNAELKIAEGQTYMPFQKAGIEYALAHAGVLIADEMGLGKTIQAIGVVNNDETIKRALVICPASLKINWQREFVRFLARDLSVGIAGESWPQTDIVIVNYDVLKKYKPAIDAVAWDALICDEAHYLKNRKTLRGQMVFGRAQRKGESDGTALAPIKARRMLMLTGTPIINRPVELHPIISALHPRWSNFFAFAKRYANATQTRWGWDFGGAANLEELQRELRATCMVRRLKADVLTELPAKIRQVVELPPTPEIEALVEAELEAYEQHEAELDELRDRVEQAEAARDTDETTYQIAVTALRDATQVAFESMSEQRKLLAIAKTPLVVAHLDDALADDPERKIIVFAHHIAVVDALMSACAERGWNPVRVTGADAMGARQAAVDAFQKDPATRIFVGNIKAAGVGLTLTASSHVVFAELDWVPGNITQAEDRAHRIGQRESVLVQHLVVDGSLDARLAKTIVKKQRIIDRALDRHIDGYTQPTSAPTSIELPPAPAAAPDPEPARAVATPSAPAAEIPSDELTQRALDALRLISGADPDRARELNGVGFNRYDGDLGHELAERSLASLSPKQRALVVKLAHKYRRQLPPDLVV